MTRFYLERGISNLKSGNNRNAIKDLKTAIKSRSSSSLDAMLLLSFYLKLIGKDNVAKKYFKEFIEKTSKESKKAKLEILEDELNFMTKKLFTCFLTNIERYLKQDYYIHHFFYSNRGLLWLEKFFIIDYEKSNIFINYFNDIFIYDVKKQYFKNFIFTKDTYLNKHISLQENNYLYKNYENINIKTKEEYSALINNVKNMKLRSNKRSFQEFSYLMNIMYDYSINLFIIKNYENDALYSKSNNAIFINLGIFNSLDHLCIVFTHELIHFCFANKLGNLKTDQIIDINDLSLFFLNIDHYNSLPKNSFYEELIAHTYEQIPNFLKSYVLNKDNKNLIYEKFGVSKNRRMSIEFISKYKIIPYYKEDDLIF